MRRINLHFLLGLLACCWAAVSGCSGEYGDFRNVGDWEGGYEPLGVAAHVQAYETAPGSDRVSLSLVCTATSDETPLMTIIWEGGPYLDGDIAAEFLFDDSRYLMQHWYSTFGGLAGPVGEDTANEFIIALGRSDRMAVALSAYSGAVRASFKTKGVQTILRSMDERCGSE